MTKKFSIKKLVAGVMAAAMVVTALPVSGLSVKAAADPAVAAAEGGGAVMCAYNPNNGEHLFTVYKAEYDANIALGYQGEGSKWTAPAKNNTPIYRVYNPNSGEHLLLPESEVAATVAAGWSNEGIKMYSDEAKGVPVYRVFNPNETRAGSHHYTTNLTEAQALVAAGWSFDYSGAPVFYGAGEDKSAEITLTDVNGLQANGTALPTDKLQVSFGANLGTPSVVTWYCNGAVHKIASLQGTSLEDDTFYVNGSLLEGGMDEGEWYVVIENTAGQIFTSNKVTVSEHKGAVITGVALEDDYETEGGVNIVFADKTPKAIVDFTLNKEYACDLYLAEDGATDWKDSAVDDHEVSGEAYDTAKHIWKIGSVDEDKWKDAEKAEDVKKESKLTTEEAMKSPGVLIYYKDKNDAVHCKYAIPDGLEVTRGKDYALVVVQDDIAETKFTSKTEKKDLNVSAKATMPYVIAPDSIALTSFSPEDENAEITMYDAKKNKLEWWGNGKADKGFVVDATKINGLTVSLYNKDENKVDDDDEKIDASKLTVDKGVITAKWSKAHGNSYAYAKVETKKGIFAKDSKTYTATLGEAATHAITGMEMEQSSDDPKDAKVTLKNLKSKASGTVVIVQNKTGADLSDDPETNKAGILAKKAIDDNSFVVGMAKVTDGKTTVVVEDVFEADQIGDEDGLDEFAAAFIPDDQSTWMKEWCGDGDGDSYLLDGVFVLEQSLQSYALTDKIKGVVNTGSEISVTNAVKGIDQFGDDITDATKLSSLEKLNDTSAYTEKFKPGSADTDASNESVTITFDGRTLEFTVSGPTNDGEKAEITLPGGQKLIVKAKGDNKYDIELK